MFVYRCPGPSVHPDSLHHARVHTQEAVPRVPVRIRSMSFIYTGVILSAATVISSVSIYFFNLIIKEPLHCLDGGFKKFAVQGRNLIQVYIGNQVQWLLVTIP